MMAENGNILRAFGSTIRFFVIAIHVVFVMSHNGDESKCFLDELGRKQSEKC